MSAPLEETRRYTIEEYLRNEQDSSQRHEYYNGEIVAMAGGSPEHSLIIANIVGEVRNRLKGSPCRIYEGNLRVKIPRSRFYVYPDATIVCGELQRDPNDRSNQTIVNPRAVVEVLSPSTEHLDYGRKFRQYLQFETLTEYVIVAQDAPHVETYFRQPEGTWLFTPVSDLTRSIPIRSVKIDLPLAEVYAAVEFPAPPAPPEPRAPDSPQT
jgi:Uma2 family endonuclease